MNGETTGPNGSRKEVKVTENENPADVQRRMIAAGFPIKVDSVLTRFSEKDIAKLNSELTPEEQAHIAKLNSNNNANSGTSDGSQGGTAGQHTIVEEKGSMSFIQQTPYIATGPHTALKGEDKKKENQKEDKENKEAGEKE